MGTEIEHRFLVDATKVPKDLSKGVRLKQAYLNFEPILRVRIKQTEGDPTRQSAFLTIKGKGRRVRAEFEYAIPLADAEELFAIAGESVIDKVRYRIGRWELDQFCGRLDGLWLAEIEMHDIAEPLPHPLPAWVGREVTEDPRFTNANLCRLKQWPAKEFPSI